MDLGQHTQVLGQGTFIHPFGEFVHLIECCRHALLVIVGLREVVLPQFLSQRINAAASFLDLRLIPDRQNQPCQ